MKSSTHQKEKTLVKISFSALAVFLYCGSVLSASTITGTVFDYYGTTRIADIVVNALEYNGNDTTVYIAVSDESGDYSLTVPAGKYLVSANPNSSSTRYSAQYYSGVNSSYYATPVTVTDGQVISDIHFYLWAAYKIQGSIQDANGNQATGSVYAFDVTTGYTYYGMTGTESRQDGSFNINLPQGVYSFIIYPDSNAFTAESFPLLFNDDTQGLTFSLRRSSYIEGRITSASGSVLESIRVDALDSANTYSYAYATTDSNGKYKIEGLLAGRSYLILARTSFHPLYYYQDLPGTFFPNTTLPESAMAVQLTGSGATNINISVPETAATISGTVKDKSGNPINGALVYDFYLSDRLNPYVVRAQRAVLTDESGQYLLTGIGTCRVGVCASADTFVPQFWQSQNMTTTLTTATSINITAGSAVTGINFNLNPLSDLQNEPVITSISPHLIFKGETKTVVLEGNDIAAKARLEIIDVYPLHYTGEYPILGSYAVEGNRITATIRTTTSTSLGPYYLAVTNPDSQYFLTGFNVIEPVAVPEIAVLSAPEKFTSDSTLTLGWNMQNLTASDQFVDVYMGIVLPTSHVIFYDNTTLTLDLKKMYDNLQLPPGTFYPQNLLLEIPLGGAAMPPGEYLWFAGIMKSGTYEVLDISLKSNDY